MKALRMLILFLAVEFLMLGFAFYIWPDARPIGDQLIGMSVTIVSAGIARKLAQ